MKPSWYLPLIVVWAFLSIELAFHVNIWIHWPAANPVALNTFNNRLALAVMLLAVRALAVSEGGGKLDFFLWVPFGAPLFMAMMPDERLWYAVSSTFVESPRTPCTVPGQATSGVRTGA